MINPEYRTKYSKLFVVVLRDVRNQLFGIP